MFTVVHVGEELRDPDDGDLLGYMAFYAGTWKPSRARAQQMGAGRADSFRRARLGP